MKTRRSTRAQREERLGWLLTIPGALIVFALILFPILWNIVLSLQQIRLIDLQSLNFLNFDINFDNFARVTGVSAFWPAIINTVVYAVFGTLLSVGVGLWAALVVRRPFRGRAAVRGFMLFPYVVPVVAATLVWQIMLNPTFGIINEWLTAGGGEPIRFLSSKSFTATILGISFDVPLALSVVILFEAWRYFPFAFLFILARLQAISGDLEDAAMVDGATISQRFRYIILPELRGVFSVLILLRFIWTFNKFDDIFLLTGGEAGTEVITIQIIDWLNGRGEIGSAAALGLILAGILSVMIFIYIKFFYREETA
jgi:multiple sugar transport system permease protein